MARNKDETAAGGPASRVQDSPVRDGGARDVTGDAAAALLVRQMKACERSMQACLALWDAKKEEDEYADDAEFFLDKAVLLAGASARLAEALARMKGESHQRIRVERVAAGGDDAPVGGALSPREALKARRKTPRGAQKEGEGGSD